MPTWKPVGPENMLADGAMAEIQVEGTPLLLARIDGAYYAVQALCPHLKAHLARGTLSRFELTCPAHGSRFDLRDGQNTAWVADLPGLAQKAARVFAKPKDLQTYLTRVQDGQVWVAIAAD